jgi:hypothetical protein
MQRYGLPDEEQWEMALRLREAIQDLPSGLSEDESLEDVYEAALRMEISAIWKSNMGMSEIFRGQRKHEWRVIPLLFRVTSNSLGDQDSLISNTEKIGRFVRQLQATDTTITDEEGVAIVQHYSEELGIGTWLIDFTWDPFVALFFASYGGEDGDVGLISYIGLEEFRHLSAGGTNRLGNPMLDLCGAVVSKLIPINRANIAILLQQLNTNKEHPGHEAYDN